MPCHMTGSFVPPILVSVGVNKTHFPPFFSSFSLPLRITSVKMSVSPLTEDSIKVRAMEVIGNSLSIMRQIHFQGMLTRNDLGRPVIQVAGMICVHMHDTSLATSANKDVVGWCLKVSDGKYTHPAWLHSSLIPHITSGKLTNRAIIKVAYRSHPPIKVWRWGNELCIT